MGDAAFFCKHWKFLNVAGQEIDKYPVSNRLIIGSDRTAVGHYTAAWLDASSQLQVLRSLTINADGDLVGSLVDLGFTWDWTISISQVGVNLLAHISAPHIEASLAGVWGAEAAPP